VELAGLEAARLEIAPPDLSDRIELLFLTDVGASAAEFERLVQDAHDLVADRLPDLELTIAWGRNAHAPS
jgi:hypothetical protein